MLLITKKWTIQTDKGKQFKYEFQVGDKVIKSTATVFRNEWNRYNVFDKIEIIFFHFELYLLFHLGML